MAASPSRKTQAAKKPKREYSSGKKDNSVRYLTTLAGFLQSKSGKPKVGTQLLVSLREQRIANRLSQKTPLYAGVNCIIEISREGLKSEVRASSLGGIQLDMGNHELENQCLWAAMPGFGSERVGRGFPGSQPVLAVGHSPSPRVYLKETSQDTSLKPPSDPI